MKEVWIGIILFLLIYGVFEIIRSNSRLRVSNFTVSSEKLSAIFDGFRIVQISDLHSKLFGKNSHRLLTAVAAQHPDLIVLTGDMVNRFDHDFSIFYSLAKELPKQAPTYYILGNHEEVFTAQTRQQLYEQLASFGVHVLDNDSVTISRGGESIHLYGLWSPLPFYRRINKPKTKENTWTTEHICQRLGLADRTKWNLLLAHNPLFFDSYVEWGADLTLCGHVHGGVVRLPWVGGLLSPERKFFPAYDAGRYDRENCTMIVSRGLGNGNPLPRIWNSPQLPVITLHSGEVEEK